MTEILEEALVFRMAGCAMRVHGEVGRGLREKTYERAQLLNYLRVTGCKVGLIMNFKHASLVWERIVLDYSR